MTLEEYKNQIYKISDEPITIGEIWNDLTRKQKRYIENRLKLGRKLPPFNEIIECSDEVES